MIASSLIEVYPPLLSIIIPNYNNAGFLKDCIGSILGQTFTNYEIIITDDCSTDNSIQIIDEYTKHYDFIHAIYHKRNVGISANRHSGIIEARGDYFTVLDSDDIYYDPRKLEKEMELIIYYKTKENKNICAFSKIAQLDKELNFIRDHWPENKIKVGYIFNEIIARTSMIPRDFIVATDAYFEVGPYDKVFSLYEDWDLKIRLAHKYDFYYTGIYGTGYRKHGTGLSQVNVYNHIKYLKMVFKKNYILIDADKRTSIKRAFYNFIHSKRSGYIKSLEQNLLSGKIKGQPSKVSIWIEIYWNKWMNLLKL